MRNLCQCGKFFFLPHICTRLYTCSCIYLGSCVHAYVCLYVVCVCVCLCVRECKRLCIGTMTFDRCLSVGFHSFGLTRHTCISYLQPHHLLILACFSKLFSLRGGKKKGERKMSGLKETWRRDSHSKISLLRILEVEIREILRSLAEFFQSYVLQIHDTVGDSSHFRFPTFKFARSPH